MKPSDQIDQRISEVAQWRGLLLSRLREMILEADPEITEEWKWNNPAWSHHGPVFGIVVETTRSKEWVQLTFFQGAALDDPNHLFNSGLDSKTMRYIKFREGDAIDESALKALLRSAVAYNLNSHQ